MACSKPLYGYRRLGMINKYGQIAPVSDRHCKKDVVPNYITPFEYVSDFFSYSSIADKRDNKFQFLRRSNFPSEQALNEAFERIGSRPDFETALIPCGRCMECRLEYSRQWANRQMLEAMISENNWFITLTYEESRLPRNSFGCPTLDKRDLSLFIKRVREHFSYNKKHSGIRFFACGEYGEKKGRPHYHVNFFNLPLYDLEYSFTKNGNVYFTSKVLNDLWVDYIKDENGKEQKISKGFVVIGELNWNTAAYVARYVVKKAKGADASIYEDLNILPEFCQMSTHPGIAREYYDMNKDRIYKYDKIVVPGGERVRPSHYYDKLYDIDDPCTLSDIKDKRIAVAEARTSLELSKTDLDPFEYQRVKHEALVKKIQQSLVREVEF